MSIEIVRAEHERHPHHLQTNINSSCFEFAQHVVEMLNAAGHKAYLMCKTSGEGQYTPPAFVPFTFIGSNGQNYLCTGFSHDAIWCDGKQYDTIGAGNDAPQPIYRNAETGVVNFDPANGPQVLGSPTWNPIPEQYWRPSNPPYKGSSSTPQPPTVQPYPSESPDGGWWGQVADVQIAATYARKNRPYPSDQKSLRWIGRIAYDIRDGLTKEASLEKHIKELEQELGL